MRIFVIGINSELGYHLAELLRNDFLMLEGYTLISGTLFTKQEFPLNESVHQSFDFNKQRDQAVKCAIQSDILIVDIRNNPPFQVQFIIKVLKHYKRNKEIKVIAISNYMTWSNAKSSQFTQIPRDKEELADFTVNSQKWKPVSLIKQNYPLRSSHPLFDYNHLLQEQIMQLRHYQSLIKPIILCTGVLYGKSGMDLGFQLQSAVLSTNTKLIDLIKSNYLTRSSNLSFTHVDQLLQTVYNIIYQEKKSQYLKDQYVILCQKQPKSILKIVQNLHKLCGNQELLNQIQQTDKNKQKNHQQQPKTFIPQLFYANNKNLFSLIFDLNFSNQSDIQSSPQEENKQNQQNQSISKEQKRQNQNLSFAKNIIDEFKKYHDVSFKHFILSEQILQQILPNQHKTQTQNNLTYDQTTIIQKLIKKYSILDKNKITQIMQKLIETGQIPQQRLATPDDDKKKSKIAITKNEKKQTFKKQPQEFFFTQIIKEFLTQNIDSNFIIILQTQLIKKMFKLLQQKEFQSLKNVKFILFKKNLNEIHDQIPQASCENVQKSVQIFSKQFFLLTGLSEFEDRLLNDDVNKESQPVNQSSQIQRNEQKIKSSTLNKAAQSQQIKVNLLSQYLLDNVVVYLSQAKQKLRQKGILKEGQKFEGKQNIKLFIKELKQIKKKQEQLLLNEEDEYKES